MTDAWHMSTVVRAQSTSKDVCLIFSRHLASFLPLYERLMSAQPGRSSSPLICLDLQTDQHGNAQEIHTDKIKWKEKKSSWNTRSQRKRHRKQERKKTQRRTLFERLSNWELRDLTSFPIESSLNGNLRSPYDCYSTLNDWWAPDEFHVAICTINTSIFLPNCTCVILSS